MRDEVSNIYSGYVHLTHGLECLFLRLVLFLAGDMSKLHAVRDVVPAFITDTALTVLGSGCGLEPSSEVSDSFDDRVGSREMRQILGERHRRVHAPEAPNGSQQLAEQFLMDL